jgi:hypothetical protein
MPENWYARPAETYWLIANDKYKMEMKRVAQQLQLAITDASDLVLLFGDQLHIVRGF